MGEIPSQLSEFRARPGQSLRAHLEGVSANVSALVTSEQQTAYGDRWDSLLETLAWIHDAGKLTSYFQEYLDTGHRRNAPRVEYTYHGSVSALLTMHALHERDLSGEAISAGFYAVAKHHSVLPDLKDAHAEYTLSAERVTARYDLIQAQLQNIDDHAAEAANEVLDRATKGEMNWNDVYVEQPDVYKKLLQNPRTLDQQFYGTVLRAWSSLVTADKLDAAGITENEEQTAQSGDRNSLSLSEIQRPASEKIREHVHELADRPLPNGRSVSDLLTNPSTTESAVDEVTDLSIEQRLDMLRTVAHADAVETLRSAHETENRIFRLTLPTGFGKTLTGLRGALELADNKESRVVYALPYTSIIDQVDAECREIFDVSPTDYEYTIHHHLVDTKTNLEELRDGDHVSDGSETLFAETWQSGLVLTTFTQLFESVAGPGNTQSMKLPALQESVILIDEPQALPHHWWSLVPRLTRYLIQEYDATIVLMTATQPKLFSRDQRLPDPLPVTETYERCIDLLRERPRVSFTLHESLRNYFEGQSPDTVSTGSAVSELLDATTGKTNTLSIVNTIESAAVMTEEISATAQESITYLCERLLDFYRHHDLGSGNDELSSEEIGQQYLHYLAEHSENSDLLVTTLTTRLRPIDRRVLISALRCVLDPDVKTAFDHVPSVTVSTQLIEAGVDVSFDRLYRDFAPLSSLVQAAGRCNRSFEGEESDVIVWRLSGADDRDYIPSTLIYGENSLLRPTKQALQTLQTASTSASISEAEMISRGVDIYYESLHDQRQTESRSDQLVTAFNEGNGELLRNASLIDETYQTRDLLIISSDGDRRRYERYDRLQDQSMWSEARRAFNGLKPLVVSVPMTDQTEDKDTELDVVDLDDDSVEYAITTGRGIQSDDISVDVER